MNSNKKKPTRAFYIFIIKPTHAFHQHILEGT